MELNADLTKREEEVAELAAWGAQKKEIATRLYISTDTVVNHMRRIYEKARVKSVGQLSAWWFCREFNISTLKNPLLGMFFMSMACLNEINHDSDTFTRTKKIKTVIVIKAKRRNND